MKLWRPSDVEPLLAELELKPSRTLGQNFLVDGNILNLIVEEADVGSGDTVLEIGGGLGVLTAPLLERARRLIVIEKDRTLWRHLARSFGDDARLALHHADALEVDLPGLLKSEGVTRVVSNLPYSVAARLLVELAGAEARPARMVVTVQKEVGDRLAAPSGGKDYGVTSVLVQRTHEVRMCRKLGPGCFLPRPQVTSAIVRMDLRSRPLGGEVDPEVFRRLVRHAFSQRRKQMISILQHAPPGLQCSRETATERLGRIDVDPRARPADLAPATWVALANQLSSSR